MASPFQKYQSEQVQQLAPGFVEAYSNAGRSIGQGLASIGQSIKEGAAEQKKQEQEDAKLKGMMAPYLKADQRVKSVEQQLAAGWMAKDADGNVFIPDEHKDKFDPVKANEAIAFYNKTGGDGSKLSSTSLIEFATAFEADKKYKAEQAALEDKRVERLKTMAEINKLNADAAEKYRGMGNMSLIGGFVSGADMSTFTVPEVKMPGFDNVSATSPGTVEGGVTRPVESAPAISSAYTGTTTTKSPETVSGFTGTTSPFYTSAGISTTPISVATTAPAGSPSSTAPATTSVPVAPAPNAVSTPMATQTSTKATSESYLKAIPELQVARAKMDEDWQKEINALTTNYNLTVARLSERGATPEQLKLTSETLKAQYELKVGRYNANVASIESRIKAYQAAAEEARAAAKAGTEVKTAEESAAEAERKRIKFETEYGKETPGVAKTTEKPTTFQDAVAQRIQNAGIIEGRSGGTIESELQQKAADRHADVMTKYPTWYQVGLTTTGGNQYQFELKPYPTGTPISPTVRAQVEEEVTGYSEGRTFLTQLMEAVDGTDENQVRNFLDRFLATTSKDDKFAEGQMLSQFGVAAFRRAIVSGGNFSDADREYVQKIITQINTANPFANKVFLKAQTQRLAEFIDSKFRANLAAKGVKVDLETSEKFLTREKDVGGLANLEAQKQFYTAYKIDPSKAPKAHKPVNELLDTASLQKRADEARSAGNTKAAEIYEKIIKENQEAAAKRLKEAEKAAARARGA